MVTLIIISILKKINKKMIFAYLNKLLGHYYKIVKNHTGIITVSYKSVIFLLLLGIISYFFRIEVLINIPNNSILQYVLLMGSVFNILFIKLNLGCRLVITTLKGIPYFIREVKNGKVKYKYLIGFIIYNMVLIFLSIVVLLRLYSVLSSYYTEIYKMVFIYNSIMSFTLCALYLEEHYSDVTFSMLEVDINDLGLLQKLLLLSLPAIIFMNLTTYITYGALILKNIISGHTIYCEGGDVSPDRQTNQKQNTQGNLRPTNNINQKINQQATTQLNPVVPVSSEVKSNVESNNQGSLPSGIISNNNSQSNSNTQTNSQTNNQLY
uniref:Uncharacterized protein n=1 Tax=Ganoderma leucocontextum TaxID=1566825 RepID=A0A2S1WBG5_9APHY|nr:hypothetical protein [Ganoderma leucocontextum]AWJ63937.1 hypothetical protein [Ganoderma leucocontextum]WVH38031.1 hypothetical protein [Ganoderma leucocontextum]